MLPLVWRRRAPVAVFGVLAAVALLQWGFGLRLGADVALLVALYTVATSQPRRTAAPGRAAPVRGQAHPSGGTPPGGVRGSVSA